MSETYCWYCRGWDLKNHKQYPMIWQNDWSPEDFGYECEGVISILTCPVCGAEAEFRHLDYETAVA